MRFQDMGILAMEDVTPEPGIEKAVCERAREGSCLIDGCDQKATTRGLCDRHYQTFVRTKRDTPARERRAFEEKLIRQGLILAPGAIRDLTSDNPFTNVG